MNRLDNLPEDIKKIINRKVQDLHIISRRFERKKNRANNRLLKHKKDVREKFIDIVEKKIEQEKYNIKHKQYNKKREKFLKERDDIENRLNLIVQDLKNKPINSYIVKITIFLLINNPYIKITLTDGDELFAIPNKYDLNYNIVSKTVFMILEQKGLLNSL